jgi:hypothetical protein
MLRGKKSEWNKSIHLILDSALRTNKTHEQFVRLKSAKHPNISKYYVFYILDKLCAIFSTEFNLQYTTYSHAYHDFSCYANEG